MQEARPQSDEGEPQKARREAPVRYVIHGAVFLGYYFLLSENGNKTIPPRPLIRAVDL